MFQDYYKKTVCPGAFAEKAFLITPKCKKTKRNYLPTASESGTSEGIIRKYNFSFFFGYQGTGRKHF